jgi:hypothetical protein
MLVVSDQQILCAGRFFASSESRPESTQSDSNDGTNDLGLVAGFRTKAPLLRQNVQRTYSSQEHFGGNSRSRC